MGFTQLGISVPNFWFGIVLVLAFAVTWQWFPAGGFPGWTEPLKSVHALILLSMFLFTIGFCTRVTSVLAWAGALSYIHRAPTTPPRINASWLATKSGSCSPVNRRGMVAAPF